jgi:hypothetical protein
MYLKQGAITPGALIEAPDLSDFAARDALYCLLTGAKNSGGATSPAHSAEEGDQAGSAGADRGARSGSLLRVPLTGGQPELLQSHLQNPASLFVGEEWICWTETRPASPVSVSVLPLTRPLTYLRALRRSTPDPLTLSVVDGDATVPAARVVGEADGALCWVEYRRNGRPSTLVKLGRISQAGGREPAVETLASEEGIHDGLVAGGMLYWMGESREGAPARAFGSVNRRTRDGRVELLGDWLSPDGTLRADGERVYYCRDGVYALPGDAGVARRLFALSAPGRLTSLAGGSAYAVTDEAGEGYRIVRRSLRGVMP